MKTVLFIIVTLLLFGSNKNITTDPNTKLGNDSDAVNKVIDFTKDIVPVLKLKCNPCHFPGGKMYERMPFDKAQTILSHETGILRRIKSVNENKLIKDFISNNTVNRPKEAMQ